jgi:hypothetical protein
MNKLYHFVLIALALPSFGFAQSGVLSVENYISQVQQSNPSAQGSILLKEASTELENEGSHLYTPNFSQIIRM